MGKSGSIAKLSQSSLFVCSTFLMYDDVQHDMEHHPYQDVDAQNNRDVHLPYHQQVYYDEQHCQQADGQHHLAHAQSAAQQLVVNVALVGQERILAVAHTVAHHSHHVQ